MTDLGDSVSAADPPSSEPSPDGLLLQAQKMEAIGLLVAGVAHELSNPLASIVGFSQLIRTDPDLPEGLRRQAEMLVQEAQRARIIVEGLLDFARRRPPERFATDLKPLIDGVLELQSYTFGKGGLEAIVEIAADVPAIEMDRAQIQQVLVNLTVNAGQALREAGGTGTVRISASTARATDGGDVVRIEIADDGPGVPREIEERLFMPFVTTKPPGSGTGLGLSVSSVIVAGHGGTLRHQRGPNGRGATFIVELPVRQGGDGTAARRARTSEQPVRTVDESRDESNSDGPVRILVLDDEASIREFLARVLRRGGYEPILAATGADALEAMADHIPDAILCDHRMAGMSGTEFHAAVSERFPELGGRFAFMSGDVLNPQLRDFATKRGILLLAKPFDIANVGRTVETLLGDRA